MRKSTILRRIIMLLPSLFIISALSYALVFFGPGNQAKDLLIKKTGSCQYSDKEIKDFSQRLDLNKSFISSYKGWLKSALKGDLGESLIYNRKVSILLKERLMVTIRMLIYALIVYIILGLSFGIVSGIKVGGICDRVSSYWASLSMALPTFWISLLALWTINKLFPSLPIFYYAGEISLLVPGVLIGMIFSSNLMRILRDRVVFIKKQNYIYSAKAMGLNSLQIKIYHIIPNLIPSFVSVLVLDFSAMLSGSMIFEKIFSVPGFGLLILDAIYVKDYPLIAGSICILCSIICILNLTAELIYVYFDRRDNKLW